MALHDTIACSECGRQLRVRAAIIAAMAAHRPRVHGAFGVTAFLVLSACMLLLLVWLSRVV